MNRLQKLEFFKYNIVRLFNSQDNDLVDFIKEVINDKEIQEAVNKWPEEIKLKMVDRYFESKL